MYTRPPSWDTETKLEKGCGMCCFSIFKVSFGFLSSALVLCAQELTVTNSAQQSWGDARCAIAVWKLWICNMALFRNSSHSPTSTVDTLWAVINGAEQIIISYWTYSRSFLVEAVDICVKNGCSAFEQITWREAAVFLFANASSNKLAPFPNNYPI